eukprot:3507985-Amphidinium_carterae.1
MIVGLVWIRYDLYRLLSVTRGLRWHVISSVWALRIGSQNVHLLFCKDCPEADKNMRVCPEAPFEAEHPFPPGMYQITNSNNREGEVTELALWQVSVEHDVRPIRSMFCSGAFVLRHLSLNSSRRRMYCYLVVWQSGEGLCTTKTLARALWIDYIFYSNATMDVAEAPQVRLLELNMGT